MPCTSPNLAHNLLSDWLWDASSLIEWSNTQDRSLSLSLCPTLDLIIVMGEILAIINRNPSVSRSKPVTRCDILGFFGGRRIPLIPLKWYVIFFEVLNSNGAISNSTGSISNDPVIKLYPQGSKRGPGIIWAGATQPVHSFLRGEGFAILPTRNECYGFGCLVSNQIHNLFNSLVDSVHLASVTY